MAYNKNISTIQNNIVVISGSQIQATGSLVGTAISGTTAQFTTVTASNVLIYGTASLTTSPDAAYIIYNSIYDKLIAFPGLYVSGNLTGSGHISASNAYFGTVTGSHSGSGAGLFNLTASGINNFTNDVRGQFGAGTGIAINSGTISVSNVPNASLQNSSITIGTTNIALGATSTALAGITSLTASSAFFQGDVRINGTASISFLETVNQQSLKIGDKYIFILSGGIDHATLDGSGIQWGSGAFSDITQDEFGSMAHVRYNGTKDKISIFPGLYVSGATGTEISGGLIVTGSTFLGTLSGTSAQFINITASFTGSGAGLFNLTASGINNFINDVRGQFSAGSNITIVAGVISSTASGSGGSGSTSPGGLDQQIQFNSGSTFGGSSNLTYDYITNILSGTTAEFTTLSASNIFIDGQPVAAATSSFLVLNASQNLTNERVLTAGTNITFTDNGAGNTLIINSSGGGSGSAIFGQLTASFSRSVHSITSFVSDAGVSLSSNIITTIALSSSRDLDEMELAPVVVAAGGITAGVGFNVIAVSLDGDADGTYLINYTRN